MSITGKKILDCLTPWKRGSGAGSWLQTSGARPSGALDAGTLVPCAWLTRVPLSSLPCVSVGKPSSLFPEDSFIDSGEIDVGRRASQKIPPGTFWRSQVFIDHPVHLKFNVSLGKAALVGIYGRKGLPPSHTQVSGPRTLSNLSGAHSHLTPGQKPSQLLRPEGKSMLLYRPHSHLPLTPFPPEEWG